MKIAHTSSASIWKVLCAALLGLLLPAHAQTWRAHLPDPSPALNGPTFVALDEARGFLYVSEHGNIDGTGGGRILKYPLAGGAPITLAPRASSTTNPEDGRFISPDAIVVDGPTGDLWIADRFLNRIQRITQNGAFVMKFGSGTPGSTTEMHGPLGLAIDEAGALYVTEHGDITGFIVDRDKVAKYTISGPPGPAATVTRQWRVGGSGTGNGQFATPYGIAVKGSTVYVSDGFNAGSRLQMLDARTGAYRDQVYLGVQGVHVIPLGIFIDSQEMLWLTESSGNDGTGFHQQISRRTLAGAPAGLTFGARGNGPGQFTLPFHFVMNAARTRGYVADYQNDRVQVFDMPGTPDTEAPTVAVRVTSSTATSATFEVAFSEPVLGGTAQSLVATGSDGVSNATVVSVWPAPTASTRFYSVVVTFAGFTGTVRLGMAPEARTTIRDLSGNYFAAGVTGAGAASATHTVVSDASVRLINLSSRLRVVSSDANRSVIAGFVIAGDEPKRVLVRAVGPGLSPLGVAGPLPNPRLQLYRGGTMIAENEDWGSQAEAAATAQRVGAFPLPSGSADAALVTTLAPGSYTALVQANGGAGVVLVEVYDAAAAQPLELQHLGNISTRGFVDTGDGQLIAGFVVTGNAPKKLLIRGIGPGLTQFGLEGVLADPQLKVFAAEAATPLAENNDWGTPQTLAPERPAATAADIQAASTQTGAFALGAGSRDAAVLVTLQPGAYSAIMSGVGGGTGAGLVEVYEVPSR